MSVRIVNSVPSVSKSHQISDQERMARVLLEKDSQKYREVISEKLEIISIDTEISNQKTFVPIKFSDGSAGKFDSSKGNIIKAAICGVVSGGRSNINGMPLIRTYDYLAFSPEYQSDEIIKLRMHDMEYQAVKLFNDSVDKEDYFLCKDGSLASLCWDMEKMNHFQFEFAFNSNPELMAKFFRMAADGQLGGAPKRINNSRSTIIKSLVGLNPHIQTLSEKEILRHVLNNNEMIILDTRGIDQLRDVSHSGFGRKTSAGYSVDSELINAYLDYKELFVDCYESVFVKLSNNPHPVKFEFLNTSMLKNFKFFKGIEIEMKGQTILPIPQVIADLEAKRGRGFAKAQYKIIDEYGRSTSELISGLAMPYRN